MIRRATAIFEYKNRLGQGFANIEKVVKCHTLAGTVMVDLLCLMG